MTYIVLEFILPAALIVGVSEIATRSSLLGALLTSLLAFVWPYHDTHDAGKFVALSPNIFWLVFPSLRVVCGVARFVEAPHRILSGTCSKHAGDAQEQSSSA